MNYLGQIAVDANSLTVGNPPEQYAFPTAIGAVGDVLTSQADGNLTFSPSTGGVSDHSELTGIGVTTHDQLDTFKSDLELKIDQDVRSVSSPSFVSINTDTLRNAAGHRVIDKAITDVTHFHCGADSLASPGYNIRCAIGSTRVNHGDDNTASYIECTKSEQLFKIAGFEKLKVAADGVTFNPNGTNSYTLPQTRGGNGEGLVSDGAGGVAWQSRSYANIYWTNNKAVTPLGPDANTYQWARGNRLGTIARDFVLIPGPPELQLLQYQGSQPKVFQLNQTVSWQSEGKSNTFAQAIFINDTLVPGSETGGRLDDNNSYPRNATTVVLVELSNADTIIGVVKNVNNIEGLLIIDYQLTVSEV